MTTILAMELFAINDLNNKIPVRVKTDAIKDSFLRKIVHQNFNTSISNQESPGPGPGIAQENKYNNGSSNNGKTKIVWEAL